jgi:hypothetical protein
MRNRIPTPFFPLPKTEPTHPSAGATVSAPPGSRGGLGPARKAGPTPARQLEGRVIDNGRYLLLRKLEHTPQAVRYAARDLVGGLEVELLLQPEHNARGYRITTRALSQQTRRPELPDLCNREQTVETVLPPSPKRGPIGRLLRALQIVQTAEVELPEAKLP